MTAKLSKMEHEPLSGNTPFLTPGEYEWYEMTKSGIVFKPGIPEEVWLEVTKTGLGYYQGAVDAELRALAVVADCLNHGSGNFKERYAQAIDGTSKFLQMRCMKTLENIASIFGSIPAENRHLDFLDLSHHALVSKYQPSTQKYLLDIADDERLTVRDFKKRITQEIVNFPNEKQPKKEDPKKTKKVIIHLEDEKSILLGMEKCGEYLLSEKADVKSMDDARLKEFSGRILALVEAFGPAMFNKFFERLTGICAHFIDDGEAAEPIREWTAARKERWAKNLISLGKAARRGGMMCAPKKGEEEVAP